MDLEPTIESVLLKCANNVYKNSWPLFDLLVYSYVTLSKGSYF